MRRRTWVTGLVVLGAIGWYLFRPELLFVNKKVNEELAAAPAASATDVATAGATVPAALAAGQFHSVAHETKGTATIHDLGGGQPGAPADRLRHLQRSRRPGLPDRGRERRVATTRRVTKAGFVELGKLKGNQGDQNYDVPRRPGPGKYRAVTIWCYRFGVNFATAPLTPAS